MSRTSLPARVVTPANMLAGLAYTLGNVAAWERLPQGEDPALRLIRDFFYTYHSLAGDTSPDDIVGLDSVRRYLRSPEPKVARFVHLMMLVRTLEQYYRANGMELEGPDSQPLQVLTDEDEAEFLNFLHLTAEILGVDGLDKTMSTIQLRAELKRIVEELTVAGEILNPDGGELFWAVVMTRPLSDLLLLDVEAVLAYLQDGMEPDDYRLMADSLADYQHRTP